MNLSQAIAKRDEYRKNGVRCQIVHKGQDVWEVIFWGINYK